MTQESVSDKRLDELIGGSIGKNQVSRFWLDVSKSLRELRALRKQSYLRPIAPELSELMNEMRESAKDMLDSEGCKTCAKTADALRELVALRAQMREARELLVRAKETALGNVESSTTLWRLERDIDAFLAPDKSAGEI